MTGEIFSEWIMELNATMRAQERTIGLVLDNCSAHPRIQELSNVTLFFLPPNTTPLTQPMDAGVIKNLKHYYRLSLSVRQLAALEHGIEFKLSLYQSIQILCTAWEKVSAKTITNCFKKAGFDCDGDRLDEGVQDDNDELDTAINCLRRHVDVPEQVNAEMMVTIDSDMETSLESLSDEEIADPEDDIEEGVVPEDVTAYDAFVALDKLRRFISSHKDHSAFCSSFSLIEIEKLIEKVIL